ncbi:hypothetical protein [Micrococcus sp.]|uniref:hypothetical protein n=1 Tax=Micrococcus sp. TaxID=1271 RepID=UPI002A915021|nr:hypothetical protein [Micrococcus sp.]MDY6056080.1 hypothetical protein [Micrococcus sp.]
MSTTAPAARPSAAHQAALTGFVRSTSRTGMWTMLAGLALSLAGPAWLFFFTDLGVTAQQVLTAWILVATTFGVLWVVEPIAYFPVLGSSAMYQAFLIGNISSKLLPAAVVAQDAVRARPGTARGDVAAVMAICGAATVHLISLFTFVGLLGTWLVSFLPQDVMLVVGTYILPAVLGAVTVQAIWSYRAARTTVTALAVGAAIAFLVVPALAPLWTPLSFLGTPLTVILTVVIAYLVRPKATPSAAEASELHY